MITVKLEPLDQSLLDSLSRRHITVEPSTYQYTAKDGDHCLGRCVYTAQGDQVVIQLLETQPAQDYLMMDGLIRASVNHAFSLGCWICQFAPDIDTTMLKQFYFEEDETNFTIDIHDLLTNHKNCSH